MTCRLPFLSSLGDYPPRGTSTAGKSGGDSKAGLPERLQVSINLRTKFWTLSSDLGGRGQAAISCRHQERRLCKTPWSPVSTATRKVRRLGEKRTGYHRAHSWDGQGAATRVGPASAPIPETLQTTDH